MSRGAPRRLGADSPYGRSFLGSAVRAALAERTGRVVTAEDHSIIGGLGSAVAEVLGENRPTPMRRVGLMDVYGESAPNDYLIEAYGISAGHVAMAAREMIEKS